MSPARSVDQVAPDRTQKILQLIRNGISFVVTKIYCYWLKPRLANSYCLRSGQQCWSTSFKT